MIEKLSVNDRLWNSVSEVYDFPADTLENKINELVEASNRQDRAISFLIWQADGGDVWRALSDQDRAYWDEMRRR
jgi:hypothetical protein